MNKTNEYINNLNETSKKYVQGEYCSPWYPLLSLCPTETIQNPYLEKATNKEWERTIRNSKVGLVIARVVTRNALYKLCK